MMYLSATAVNQDLDPVALTTCLSATTAPRGLGPVASLIHNPVHPSAAEADEGRDTESQSFIINTS